jgi:large subunit ribosomal protein L20
MRVRPGAATRHRRKRVLRRASGFWGTKSKLFKQAKQFVIKAERYAFRDRRAKKRDFRQLWIARISAACDSRGMSYSHFAAGLKRANVYLNRKMLSEVAVYDPPAFDKILDMSRKALAAQAAA